MKTTTHSSMNAGETRDSRTAIASLAAIGSVIAASSCCLPILPFAFAAGFAGTSAVLGVMRPYLLGAAVLFIAYGFYQAWRTKQCQRRPSLLSYLFLGASTVLVAVSIVFPQVLANAAANLFARGTR